MSIRMPSLLTGMRYGLACGSLFESTGGVDEPVLVVPRRLAADFVQCISSDIFDVVELVL